MLVSSLSEALQAAQALQAVQGASIGYFVCLMVCWMVTVSLSVESFLAELIGHLCLLNVEVKYAVPNFEQQ
jgi:hypothetical protein